MIRILATSLLVIFGLSFFGQIPSGLSKQSDMIMLGVPAQVSEPVNDFYTELENQISSLSTAISEYQQKIDSLNAEVEMELVEKDAQISLFTDTIAQAKQMIETNRRILRGRIVVHTAEN
ncbi:MAG: hypothetical protein R3D00_17325 [Bacteroidia bacterium]